MTCTLGRASLPSPDFITQDGGGRLRVGHRAGYPLSTALGQILAQQVTGYPNPDEEVVRFIYDATASGGVLDGFYFVASTSVNWVKLAAGLFAWEAELIPVDAPEVQAPVLAALRTNGLSVAIGTALSMYALPPSTLSRGSETTAIVASAQIVNRISADGDVYVTDVGLSAAGLAATAHWVPTPSGAYASAVALEVSSDSGSTFWQVTGRKIPNLPTYVRLSNGLVRFRTTTTADVTELSVQHFDGTQWETAKLFRLTVDSSYTDLAFSPKAVTVLVNSPGVVSVRLALGTATGSTRYSLDVTLRRGSRNVEFLWTFGSSFANQGIKLVTAAAATALTGGIRSTNNDTDGNKFVIATADTVAATDTTNGRIRFASADPKRFMISNAIGGTVGNDIDQTQGLVYEYLGLSEIVEEIAAR